MEHTQSPEAFPLYSDSYPWNNQVNETLGITDELKTMSQATNFIKEILSFLAYGGSSIVKTLTSFHMQMVRSDVEISASVGGFSACKLWWPVPSLSCDHNIQKRNHTV
jgi:hypothetical protein